jgi:F0F1-type ATP synthase membrane subunit b/b'
MTCRAIISGVALALVVVGLARPVHAQVETPPGGEPWGEPREGGAGEATAPGGHGAAHQVGLPFESINWFDFAFQDEPSEEYYQQFGVEHPGPPVLAVLLNFALLVLVLYVAARKPLAAYLQARSDKVRDGLTEAKKLLEAANERLAEYSARLERLDEEMTKLREEFVAAGEAERDRMIADAGAKAARFRRDAELRLKQEFSQLREELRVETVEKAVAAATTALVSEVTERDRARLVEEYLDHIEHEGQGR